MYKILICLFGIFSVSAYAQVLDDASWGFFHDIPFAEIRNAGIGNYHFDLPINSTMMENNEDQKPTLRVYAGGKIALTGKQTLHYVSPQFQNREVVNRDYFLSSRVFPDLSSSLQIGNHGFFVNYFTENALDVHFRGTWSIGYQRDDGYYSIQTTNFNTSIQSQVLELGSSYKVNPTITLSFGGITRRYQYLWDISVVPSVTYRRDFFAKGQFFATIDYHPMNSLRTYFSLTTQNSGISLIDDAERLDTVPVVVTGAKISNFGTIDYGVQYDVTKYLKLSLEVRHQFLEDSSFVIKDNGDEAFHQRHIWNNELSLGATITPIHAIKLGALYSSYIKYDNYWGVRQTSWSDGLLVYRIKSPHRLIFSADVTISSFIVKALYQQSSSHYDLFDGDTSTDQLQFLTIGVDYFFHL